MTKYRARRTEVDGIMFDSAAEARRYGELKLMQRAGVISDLRLQPQFELLAKFTDAAGNKHRSITYRADFTYLEKGQVIVEDVKGMLTPVYKLKKKLFLNQRRDVVFLEIGLNGTVR